ARPEAVSAPPKPVASQPREADAVYQNGRIVARVIGAQVDAEAKELRFAEVHNSDELVLPDECEFQRYRIMVQRIAHATKVVKGLSDNLQADGQMIAAEATRHREGGPTREISGRLDFAAALEHVIQVGFDGRRHDQQAWRNQDLKALEQFGEFSSHLGADAH